MIYLVRHGETVWNREGRYQGAMNSTLTPLGRSQAASIGKTLATTIGRQLHPLMTHVSPLGRAQETAAIISQFIPLTMSSEPQIAEISFGSWDGKSIREIERDCQILADENHQHNWLFRSPDGETFESARDRIEAWLQGLTEPALVVTHALTSKLIRGIRRELNRDDTLQLDSPQDGFFILDLRQSHFVRCI